MGRERLTGKDIERERQMELEQVSGGIMDRGIIAEDGEIMNCFQHFLCVRVCLCGRKKSTVYHLQYRD